MDKRKDVGSKILSGLQHLILMIGIKDIPKVQLHNCMSCSHLRQKPPRRMDSSLSSTLYPINQTIQGTSHSIGLNSAHILGKSHQRHSKKQRPHLCWKIPLEHHTTQVCQSIQKGGSSMVSIPWIRSFRCSGFSFSGPPVDLF